MHLKPRRAKNTKYYQPNILNKYKYVRDRQISGNKQHHLYGIRRATVAARNVVLSPVIVSASAEDSPVARVIRCR